MKGDPLQNGEHGTFFPWKPRGTKRATVSTFEQKRVTLKTIVKEQSRAKTPVERSQPMRRFAENQFGLKARQSRSQLELQLLERTAELEELTKRLLKVQDEERRRIARDLHDSTGQTLVALKMGIFALQKKPETSQHTKHYLSNLSDLADQALQEIRTTSYLLHPPLLDAAGFGSAAQWYIEGFAKRSGLKIKMQFAREYERLPDAIEIALFRVLQESLTNVHRHSGANEVHVRFRRDSKGAVLEVRDFGRGLPKDVNASGAPGRSSGVGLTGIRERLNELKGELELEPAVPGTILRATIPLFGQDGAHSSHAFSQSPMKMTSAPPN